MLLLPVDNWDMMVIHKIFFFTYYYYRIHFAGGYTQSTSSHVPGATTDPVEYHCTGREATLQACNSRTLSSCTRGVSLACVHANTTGEYNTHTCTNSVMELEGYTVHYIYHAGTSMHI